MKKTIFLLLITLGLLLSACRRDRPLGPEPPGPGVDPPCFECYAK